MDTADVSSLPRFRLVQVRLARFRSRGSAVGAAAALLGMLSSFGWTLTPTQIAKISANDVDRYDFFGPSVDMDGGTVVVSSFGNDHDGPVQGAAYVFVRRGVLWVQQAKLVAAGPATGDGFGTQVAVEGNIAVTAARINTFYGAAHGYVFVRSGAGVWSQEATLAIAPVFPAQAQGLPPVDIDAGTVVIGGIVYVRQDGVWREQGRLSADGRTEVRAVAIDGNTIVARLVAHSSDPGGVYVFTRSSGVWSLQTSLPDTSASWSVAVDGGTALVGHGGAWRQPGFVQVFTRSGSIWTRQATLTASDVDVTWSDETEGFGASVALDGNRALIGAVRDNITGAAYLFTRRDGIWRQRAKLNPNDSAERGFATSIAVDGDSAIFGAYHSGAVPDGGPVWEEGAAYLFSLARKPRLLCSPDVDGDGRVDLVLLTAEGRVAVRGLDGRLINRFFLEAFTELVDARVMADTNSNAAPELAVYGTTEPIPTQDGNPHTPLRAETRDLLTGGTLAVIDFGSGEMPHRLALMGDQTGNGVGELAGLRRFGPEAESRRTARVQIEDGLGAGTVATVSFGAYLRPRDLAVLPDVNGNGAAELALLSDHERLARSDKVEVRDSATGAVVREFWLGPGWTALQQAFVADRGGSQQSRIAVLRANESGAVNVLFRNLHSGRAQGSSPFDPAYVPSRMLRVADVDGNGADDLAVFGRRGDGTQKAVVRDSRTRAVLTTMFFDRNFPGQDVVACGDTNGNGAPELAVLGRGAHGQLKAMVRDARSGRPIATVWF